LTAAADGRRLTAVDTQTIGIVGMVCAGLGIVSTVLYHVVRLKELRVLREIRDRLEKPSG
jgi:hypothetical protein